MTKKWIEVNDLSSGQYSASKNIRFKTSMLRSHDYSNAYIVVKGRISVRDNNANDQENKKLNFKNTASFRSCMSKSITYLQTIQKILMLLCQCIIC